MIKAENCTYADQYIELYEGGIAIDLDNKAVFIKIDDENHMFDGWVGDINITLDHKPQDLNVRSGNTFFSSVMRSTTLIITQGDVIYKKNLDDVAIAPLVQGVELAGYKWKVEKDLSAESFVITAKN